ncbi:ABC transporter ATP-binding protein [Alienimonas sp. DA493]|uniref:ABC transporter ATP-binding protein n=1 Tax=Alienimonas sp. DA493 TaxID=3373605 RepID=UPI00375421BB
MSTTTPALRVSGLGKRYALGLTHAGSLSGIANRWSRRLRGLPPEESTVDAEPGEAPKTGSFWALRDVNFEVQPGEVVGVIGRNGAGKSTLLKVLSRVTAPTEGVVEVNGRVGSLLEVGTGFHPELTGRENVYMNATLLGMTKREVNAKLDEIVAFSGIEKFLDTPVKRYSSGMTVRLGFAVAAHLDPEVLIVDEVLAVGDAEFQKKCLGKMKDVAGEGRTVLFVSHNMAAVRNLCHRGILLSAGRVATEGAVGSVITQYLAGQSASRQANGVLPGPRSGNGALRLQGFHFEDLDGRILRTVSCGDSAVLCLTYKSGENSAARSQFSDREIPVDVGFSIHDEMDDTLCVLYSSYCGTTFAAGSSGVFRCRIDRFPLPHGRYRLGARLLQRGEELDWPQAGLGYFEVESGDFYGTGRVGFPKAQFMLDGRWEHKELRDAARGENALTTAATG